jgi:hypothetical protein
VSRDDRGDARKPKQQSSEDSNGRKARHKYKKPLKMLQRNVKLKGGTVVIDRTEGKANFEFDNVEGYLFAFTAPSASSTVCGCVQRLNHFHLSKLMKLFRVLSGIVLVNMENLSKY